MEIDRYFAFGYARHVLCNPLSEAKFGEMLELPRAAGWLRRLWQGGAPDPHRAPLEWQWPGSRPLAVFRRGGASANRGGRSR